MRRLPPCTRTLRRRPGRTRGRRREHRLAALHAIQPLIHSLGITGVVDPAVVAAELAAYIKCHQREQLTLRVVAMPHPAADDGSDDVIEALDALGVRTGLGNDWLRVGV